MKVDSNYSSRKRVRIPIKVRNFSINARRHSFEDSINDRFRKCVDVIDELNEYFNDYHYLYHIRNIQRTIQSTFRISLVSALDDSICQ
jgi:hypothetical protein